MLYLSPSWADEPLRGLPASPYLAHLQRSRSSAGPPPQLDALLPLRSKPLRTSRSCRECDATALAFPTLRPYGRTCPRWRCAGMLPDSEQRFEVRDHKCGGRASSIHDGRAVQSQLVVGRPYPTLHHSPLQVLNLPSGVVPPDASGHFRDITANRWFNFRPRAL